MARNPNVPTAGAALWLRRLEKAVVQLERVGGDSDAAVTMGEDWQRGMVRHYSEAVDRLLSAKPEGVDRRSEALRARALTILRRFYPVER